MLHPFRTVARSAEVWHTLMEVFQAKQLERWAILSKDARDSIPTLVGMFRENRQDIKTSERKKNIYM